MSTLKVNTIQDTGGSNASTPSEIANGRVKAWVHYDGDNATIDAHYNISSVTDNGTGDYTFNFTTSFSDVHYAWSGTASTAGTTRQTMRCLGFQSTNQTISDGAITTGSTRVVTVLCTNNDRYDTDHVMVHWTR